MATQRRGFYCETNLLLQGGRLEREEELLHVVFPQLVDAAGVDGPAQELIYLLLWVHSLLHTAAGQRERERDGWLDREKERDRETEREREREIERDR